jgi:acetolactate decarboxylase
MAMLNCDVPLSLLTALQAHAIEERTSASRLVTSALAQYFESTIHTLFQVSTSGALVKGLNSGAVTCRTILSHGDFGLGTFENLDGEMIVLDGRVYRARGDGVLSEAADGDTAPFAVVTRFTPEVHADIPPARSLDALLGRCDGYRSSNNVFYALRLDGYFREVKVRAVSPPAARGGLVAAAQSEAVFRFNGVVGTLVGLWAPEFSGAISIAGYHFHFLSADRKAGGHLLGCDAEALHLQLEALDNFHIVLPENEAFLRADLTRNVAADLVYAERAH